MKVSAVDLNIRLEAVVKQADDAWIASCPSLDISTQEHDRTSALEALKEAVQLWFESCVERGVLDQALLEAGFDRSRDSRVFDDRDSGQDYIEISIPAYSASRP